MMLMVIIQVVPTRSEYRWGILSAFSRPMPVRHNAAVFPRLFTTHKDLNLPLTSDEAGIAENRSFALEGSLLVRVVLS